MSGKRKRNHWVSQSYLRGFAADPERREKIWRFSKNAGDPELKPVENVAVRFYLYAPRGADGKRDYSFEEKLGQLERLFGEPIWAELCNGMVDLGSEPLRKMLALLVAVMYLRNPAQLEYWTKLHARFVSWISAMPDVPETIEVRGKEVRLDRESWPVYRDAGPEELKQSWIEYIGGAASFAEMLLEMRWAVVCSDEPVFITSDNPVTVLHPSLAFHGLKDPDTSVIFPLSPTRVLHLDNLHSEPDNQYYPVKPGPAAINLLQWRGANEYMFSHRQTDLVCAELLRAAEEGEFA